MILKEQRPSFDSKRNITSIKLNQSNNCCLNFLTSIDLVVATKPANHPKPSKTTWNHPKPPETIQNHPPKTIHCHRAHPESARNYTNQSKTVHIDVKICRYYQHYPKIVKGVGSRHPESLLKQSYHNKIFIPRNY